MTLYERIRQLRIQSGMSQDDLAKAMGYRDRSMITKIESGKVDISQKKIVAFANALHTTTSYLMGLDESSPPEDQPKNDNIRLLIRGLNKLSPAQLEQAKNMMRIMFSEYSDYFEEKENDK
jgi:transcriptional regulator with XRE-family HTH domain